VSNIVATITAFVSRVDANAVQALALRDKTAQRSGRPKNGSEPPPSTCANRESNQLSIRIDYPGSQNYSQVTYDGLGRNVKIVEVTGGSTTSTKQFVWRDSLRDEERDGSGAVTKKFFSRGQTISGSNYFYDLDHLTSVREMTDGSGNVQAQYASDPYGQPTKLQGSLDSDFQFANYYQHSRSGLNLTWFRAYNSKLGRWHSRDPLGEFASGSNAINLYTYAFGSPLLFVDPLGLELRVYSSPGFGCKCFQHVFVWSTEENTGTGSTGSSGSGLGRGTGIGAGYPTKGPNKFDPATSNWPYVPVEPPPGVCEMDVLRAVARHENKKVFCPVVNDCHSAVKRGFAEYGIPFKTPYGRVKGPGEKCCEEAKIKGQPASASGK